MLVDVLIVVVELIDLIEGFHSQTKKKSGPT
jgi:hypothetical protein